MGDGRYYTFYQFFAIVILVFLSMLVIVSMVVNYYRNKEKKKTDPVFRIFIMLLLTIILKTVEIVIPSFLFAKALRYSISIVLLSVLLKFYCYLATEIFTVYKGYIGLLKDKARLISKTFIVILLFLGFYTNGKFLITDYNFFDIDYSSFYLMLLFVFWIFYVIYAVCILKSNKQVHKIYNNFTSIFLIIISFIVPIGIYILMITFRCQCLDFIEIFICFVWSILLNITVYGESNSGLTVLAFDKIGDIILDYVFVTDTYGNIIYKNQSAAYSTFFTKNETIDMRNIKQIYNQEVSLKLNSEGKEYVKLTRGDKQYYFTHKHNTLKNRGVIIGYIITIIDITELMNLLYYLEDRKEKSKEANFKLKNYSKVVYHLEKEKEINTLLEEIITSRESDMEKLVQMIDNLEISIDDENFEDFIDEAINYNSDILNDVRKAVTTYRQHYGG